MDQSQKQAQTQAIIQANAEASARQEAQLVSGQGKSQQQYQAEKTAAYLGALGQGGGTISSPQDIQKASRAGVSLEPTNIFTPSPSAAESTLAGLAKTGSAYTQQKNMQGDLGGLLSGLGAEQAAAQAAFRAQQQQAPPLLLSGEDTNAKPDYGKAFSGLDSGVLGISSKSTGNRVSQDQLNEAARKASAGLSGSYFGTERTVYGPQAGQRATANPNVGVNAPNRFLYSPETEPGPTRQPIPVQGPTVAGIPLITGNQAASPTASSLLSGVTLASNVPVTSGGTVVVKPDDLTNFQNTNPAFTNSLNSFVSQAAAQKGANSISVDFGNGQIKSYPIATARQQILNDVAANFAQNPTQAGQIKMFSSYSYVQPRTAAQKANDVAAVNQISSDIQKARSNGADTFNIYANGVQVGSTSGDRAFHDIIGARKQYGAVQIEATNAQAAASSQKSLNSYLTGQGGATQVDIYDKNGNKVGTAPIKYAQQEVSAATSLFGDISVKATNPLVAQQAHTAAINSINDIKQGISDAKAAGATSIDIVDAKGNIVKSVSPDNAYRALIVATSGGKAASIRYSVLGNEPNTSDYNSYLIGSGITKGTTPSDYLSYYGGRLQSGFANPIGGLINQGARALGQPEPLRLTPTVSDMFFGAAIGAGQKAVGLASPTETRTPLNILTQEGGKAVQAIQQNPLGFAAELPGEAANWWLPAKPVGVVTRALIPVADRLALRGAQKANDIIITDVLREGQAEYGVQKTGPSTEFFQGTAGKSGLDVMSPEISRFRTSLGGKEIEPGYTSTKLTNLPPIEEIFKIGPKGEAIPTGTGKVNLPNPKGEVPVEVPGGFLGTGPESVVSAVRSDASGLPIDTAIAHNISPDLADTLGLKPTGAKNTYFGQVSEANRAAFETAVKNKELVMPRDIFSFYKKDILENPSAYYGLIRNPTDITNINAVRQGKVVAPSVMGQFEGKYTGKAPKEVTQGGKRPVKKGRSFYDEEFGLAGQSEGHVGAGSSGKAQALTVSEQNMFRDLFTVPKPSVPRQRYDYLGPVLTSEERRQKARQASTTEELFFTPIPQGAQRPQVRTTTQTALASLNKASTGVLTKGQTAFKFDILPNLDLGQKERTNTIFRITPEVTPRQTPSVTQQTGTFQIPGLSQVPRVTQKQPEAFFFGLGTEQQQKEQGLLTTDIPYKGRPGGLFIPSSFVPYLPGYAASEPKKKGGNKKNYILYGTNPDVVGDFYTKGLPEQTVSSSPGIFAQGEKIIAKANRGVGISGLVSTTIGKQRSKSTQLRSVFSSGPTQLPKRKKEKGNWITGEGPRPKGRKARSLLY